MNYWIVQCNINYFDWFKFINYIKENNINLDTWVINPKMHKNILPRVKISDTTFVWLTGKETRGI